MRDKEDARAQVAEQFEDFVNRGLRMDRDDHAGRVLQAAGFEHATKPGSWFQSAKPCCPLRESSQTSTEAKPRDLEPTVRQGSCGRWSTAGVPGSTAPRVRSRSTTGEAATGDHDDAGCAEHHKGVTESGDADD
ncbi:MAG: hypothetical protein CTY20_14295 [Hyphomicrobium sp.]|nr:MAG: hypothetical protein CTY20_14295 [Hyphomicrobium sp.]